jgi:2-polyprenyl-3-methyl-5-hydroxy-6-metoxy-1,4-benzoquinol methylase
MSRSTKKYIDAGEMKKDPSQYTNIHIMKSWILREPYLYEWFEEHVSKDASILELGCGRGYFLDQLHARGYNKLSGMDLANYLPKNKYTHYAIDLNVEKWTAIPDESVDVVCCFQTIEHLENYFLVMHEAHRVLKKGGCLFTRSPIRLIFSTASNSLLPATSSAGTYTTSISFS